MNFRCKRIRDAPSNCLYSWWNLESESESLSVVSNSLWLHGLYSSWNSPGHGTKVEPFPSPGHLPNPGIEPMFPTLQADSLPVEPQGKPKSTGVSSLSLLQQIFLTQELNWDHLHCRQSLYQLSYLGSLWNLAVLSFENALLTCGTFSTLPTFYPSNDLFTDFPNSALSLSLLIRFSFRSLPPKCHLTLQKE